MSWKHGLAENLPQGGRSLRVLAITTVAGLTRILEARRLSPPVCTVTARVVSLGVHQSRCPWRPGSCSCMIEQIILREIWQIVFHPLPTIAPASRKVFLVISAANGRRSFQWQCLLICLYFGTNLCPSDSQSESGARPGLGWLLPHLPPARSALQL